MVTGGGRPTLVFQCRLRHCKHLHRRLPTPTPATAGPEGRNARCPAVTDSACVAYHIQPEAHHGGWGPTMQAMELRGSDAIYFAAGMVVFAEVVTGFVLWWFQRMPPRTGRDWPRWMWPVYWIGVALSVPAVVGLLSVASSI